MKIFAFIMALGLLSGCTQMQQLDDWAAEKTAPIRAELDRIDAKLTEMLADQTPVEDALAWAGDKWRDACAEVDGEWVAADDKPLTPGECKKDGGTLF